MASEVRRTSATVNPGKAALWLIAVTLLVTCIARNAQSQSALDGFDPNANNSVNAIVVQPDGKILLGGNFNTILGVARYGIARLNADGTLDTGFDPNLTFEGSNPGQVYNIVLQPDGKILICGSFRRVGGVPRGDLARLDPITGAADSFSPNPNFIVLTLALQADGKVLVSGGFDTIGGQMRHFIARLDPVTGLADSFNPNPHSSTDSNTTIVTMAVQSDGKILVGGYFNTISGQARNHLARLNPDGSLDPAFNPNPNDSIDRIKLQPDGKILVSGIFRNFSGGNSIGGQTRNYLARLDSATGAADSFNANMTTGNVYGMALQPDGKVVVAGFFFSGTIGGQARSTVARLDPNTGLADSFDPNVSLQQNRPTTAYADVTTARPGVSPDISPPPTASVVAIAVQADGKILLGGQFNRLAPNGGPIITRNNIARVEIDGLADQTLDLNLIGQNIYASAVQPDGKIVIGGSFTSVLGVARNNIARLNTDGTLDTTFDPNANNEVDAVAVTAEGKILASGTFSSIGGQPRDYMARLDATTGAADSFNPNPNDRVNAISVQADGKILAGGNFTTIGGASRPRIARLDATSGLADSFAPAANGRVNSILVQGDGKIVVGGEFNKIGGQRRHFIARLDPSTAAADAFNPNADNFVNALSVQGDGRIVAGGEFTTIGGQARSRIARLDATSGAADSFAPNANGAVSSIQLQADGKIIASGSFTNIGGQPRNYLARLNGATSLADSFDANANNEVRSLTLPRDGKILAGGSFTAIAGQTRNHFARLTNDAPALQNLAVTQSSVTWTRGGSSSQFTRVGFEYSTDNVNYTPLGNGTATGSNWTLIGLNFATGQTFYIRARGYYRSGGENGSESINESVRDVFISPPPLPSRGRLEKDSWRNSTRHRFAADR